MQCPNCSSETWDNTEKVNGGWKGPLRKCKDKSCGWVLWPPKEKKGNGGAPAKAGPKWTWGTLSQTYWRSLLIAKKHVASVFKDATPQDVIAATATVFIAASRDGVSEPKKELAATSEPLDKRPAALDDDDDSDLPF